MPISAAITTIGQAITIAKSLRDFDRELDSATYKVKIADLYTSLADVKIALSDALQEINQKDVIINELENKIISLQQGQICPICNTGRLKVVASKPHPKLGVVGVQERTLRCQSDGCNHSELSMHDPNGLIKSR